MSGSALVTLAHNMVETLRDDRIDEADALYQQMCEMDTSAREMLVFPVLIAIQRGQALEALQHINSLPTDRCPELRALCLQMVGDPSWHGEATALLDSPDPAIGQAMRQLLGQ
ncbi:hypothetical protein GN316_14245 [Xylophilus sp. Kf1]|nr:hypothetical protein [Xylophilus sp. Kf1]